MPLLQCRQYILFLGALAGLLLSVASSAASNDCAPLLVSGKPDNAPISEERNGQLAGIGYELFARAAERTAIEWRQTQPLPWPRVLNWGRSGKIDVVIGMRKSDEREHDFLFLNPPLTVTANAVFLLKDKRAQIQAISDLYPLVGGLTRETTLDENFTRYHHGRLNLTHVASVKQNVLMLAQYNRIDYFIAPLLPTIRYIQLYEPQLLQRIAFLKEPVSRTEEYIAISKASAACSGYWQELEVALKAEVDEGKFDAMLTRELAEWEAIDWYMDNLQYEY